MFSSLGGGATMLPMSGTPGGYFDRIDDARRIVLRRLTTRVKLTFSNIKTLQRVVFDHFEARYRTGADGEVLAAGLWQIPSLHAKWTRIHVCLSSRNEDSPQQATGYQKENRLLMRNHGFSNSSL